MVGTKLFKLFRTPSLSNTQRSRSKGSKRSLEEAGYATEEKASAVEVRLVKEPAPPQARQEHRSVEVRQQEEKEFIRKNDTAEAHVWYLIDVKWLTQWKHAKRPDCEKMCWLCRAGEHTNKLNSRPQTCDPRLQSISK